MASEIVSFTKSESVILTMTDADVAAAIATPAFTNRFPDALSFLEGTGQDTVAKAAILQATATTTPAAQILGSTAVSRAPSMRPGQDGETFTTLRFWKIWNLDTTNDLKVWGSTDAPAKLATVFTIPPSTSAHLSSIEGVCPSSTAWAIATTSKFNYESSAGSVKFIAIFVGE